MTAFFRWAPAMTVSTLSSRSAWVTVLRPCRTARRAPSLTMLASSAPEAPAVARAMASQSTSPSICTCLPWTFRMATRPWRSGSSTRTRRSNRPGRMRAGSRLSGRLVAASSTTPLLESKPSISASSWFFLPMASISSMNTMQGAFSPACLNRSRTLAAPMPTNISTNSEPEMEKKGTLASPATALASRVLPVPGGPTSSTPLGSFAPISAYFWGLWRKSTTSIRASLASSWPATSAKDTPVEASST